MEIGSEMTATEEKRLSRHHIIALKGTGLARARYYFCRMNAVLESKLRMTFGCVECLLAFYINCYTAFHCSERFSMLRQNVQVVVCKASKKRTLNDNNTMVQHRCKRSRTVGEHSELVLPNGECHGSLS